MSKTKSESEVKDKALTKVALAMYRDPKDTKYVLVEVEFTPGDTNVKELARDIREDIIDKFKTEAANDFFSDI